MNRYDFPNAGINETDGRRGFDIAIGGGLRVCKSTPSYIEDEGGAIIGQTFERQTAPNDKIRMAEIWHRAILWAAAPDMLTALKALLAACPLPDDLRHVSDASCAAHDLAAAAIAKAEGR